MQDLLDLVAKDPDLTESKQKNLACSNRKFVAYLGLDLHMPANFPVYREHLKRFHLGNARISNRRWANIKSDVAFALRRYGARKTWDGPHDLLPAWQARRETLRSDRFRRGLSRLMHWCSRNGIDPEQVDDAVLTDYHRHLIEETFGQKPNHIYRETCKLWNDAVEQILGWPQRKVTLPCYRKFVSLPRADLPEDFWKDFERYRRCRLGQDLASDQRYDTTAMATRNSCAASPPPWCESAGRPLRSWPCPRSVIIPGSRRRSSPSMIALAAPVPACRSWQQLCWQSPGITWICHRNEWKRSPGSSAV